MAAFASSSQSVSNVGKEMHKTGVFLFNAFRRIKGLGEFLGCKPFEPVFQLTFLDVTSNSTIAKMELVKITEVERLRTTESNLSSDLPKLSVTFAFC